MGDIEVTSVSSRGQVVIPQSLRDRMGIHAGEKFVVIGEDNTIVLRKLEMPSFTGIDKLLKKTRDFAKKKGMHLSNVGEAIKQARKK
ncbi:MAG: AbrB/MazE/SpoVT family DNA-binding domain-containing protein [Nanoarchaeota archaeon]|nr:AbrB/MazE/SpoVT family DNA-binding domain-containing protein [Nanoarchaeota archaeon]MBU1321200.1 AbrB/MazE/SpoVT family DNA-binding domain-containing protein [Nanoarchaeota archaeon]MBU1597005.1 AbrB/MazE/SpoVT family DNA-binding domain-containing protein [Nanoarchaeota archaeon]MBU2441849.1 AbrB/MazE/SpoVT family DNA-binding domain-containing protein [Nanoarchaeota archaeon]